jgi:dTDP-4-dehydrorhamnose reductase
MTSFESNAPASLGSIVLIGQTGMLARAWRNLLDGQGQPYQTIARPTLDLNEPATIPRAIKPPVDVVVNCAAWTDVDGAEADEPRATQVNGHGVGALARHCAAIGATLVHYSTDYVFNGQTNEPYGVDRQRDPINAYGRGKAEGERQIKQSGAAHLIIRTSWLYAPWGKNFVTTMAQLTQQREHLDVVDDQRGRPTSAQHLAGASRALLQQQARGTYHVTDGGQCTWYELACAVRDDVGSVCDISPCSSDAFPRPAKRPANSVLDLSKTEALIEARPHWRGEVQSVLRERARTPQGAS